MSKIHITNNENSAKENPKKRRIVLNDGIPTESNNRKFGQATRTPKACELCRKQKTRCFKSDTGEVSCSRCLFLNKPCSFRERESLSLSPSTQTRDIITDQQTKMKLDLIYSGVNELLSIIRSNDGKHEITNRDARLLLEVADRKPNSIQTDVSRQNFPTNTTSNIEIESLVDPESKPSFQCPSNSFKVAPFSLICNQVESANIPRSISNLLNLSTLNRDLKSYNFGKSHEDIISLRLLTEAEAIDLVNKFRRNYGRWVLFPSNTSTEVLVDKIRSKCPLLLTTCCCLSLRYLFKGVNSTHLEVLNKKKSDYRSLVKQLAKELNNSLMRYTTSQHSKFNNGDIEFLQALVILSIYSLSLSSIASSRLSLELDDDKLLNDLNLDAWYLSSIGLTTFVSSANFGTLLQKKNSVGSELPFTIFYDEMDSEDYQTLTTLRIFNHLTLVHLINCIFTGRMCVVDEIRLNYCTATLSLPSSTNFDGRMVSEIGILLITYNYVQVTLNDPTIATLEEYESNYHSTKDDMNAWFNQWEYIFNQPAVQFVELCYHFCGLIVIYTYIFRKSTLLSAVKFQVFDIFDENNIDYVLEHFDSQSLRELIAHACQLLKFINEIESDAYFAYLSDQVHFCFYFTTILLIKVSSSLSPSEMLQILPETFNLDIVLKDIHLLLEKFHTIQQGTDDIISKYELGVTYALKKLLMTFE